MPKAAGVQLLLQIWNSPGALALVRANFLTTTRCDEPALSIDELVDLSNRVTTDPLPGDLRAPPKAFNCRVNCSGGLPGAP
jgi:hypothetical protein